MVRDSRFDFPAGTKKIINSADLFAFVLDIQVLT